MNKCTYVDNIPDFKDPSGIWVRSYCHIPHEYHSTRANVVWKNINARCKVGGSEQKRYPTYIGTINGFYDFQEFASWCQDQYGYLNKEENGKYWHLDKDLIEYGNKEYCPEKCIFVPSRINSLLTTNDATRGEWPLGVCWIKHANKFRAQGNDGKGKSKYLGYFIDPFEAHQAWQKAKINVMQNILLTDEEVKQHIKLTPIIEMHIQRLQDDLNKGLETI